MEPSLVVHLEIPPFHGNFNGNVLKKLSDTFESESFFTNGIPRIEILFEVSYTFVSLWLSKSKIYIELEFPCKGFLKVSVVPLNTNKSCIISGEDIINLPSYNLLSVVFFKSSSQSSPCSSAPNSLDISKISLSL
ncbi:MAG: hypothetical protein ACK5M1_12720 [Xanthomarina gelatinilytica]|uniref:hypothetical protein n=1 Tax=Xanthomarina gelatinilytica TaxID=1137281 RepID=UPI003A84B09D